jgi:glycosyltransferase 2 family protein
VSTTSADPRHLDSPAAHTWHIGLLTKTEPGRRNRRPIDGVFLAVASVVLGLSAVIARSAADHDKAVADALATVLGWAGPLWRTLFVAVLALAATIALDVLLRRRWDLARDLLVAGLVLVGVAMLLGGVVASKWVPIEPSLLSKWGYPEVRLAVATTVLVVVGPELVRPVRLLAIWLVPLAALGAVVFAAALPSAVLGALALGFATAALVRLVFGTAAGVPPAVDVKLALASLGVDVPDLKVATRQRIGSAEYVGHRADGEPLKVRVLGRDAQDTQRLTRWWRSLSYRDPPRSVASGRLEQVEHEAFATLFAAQSGVAAPPVVTAALGPSGDAFIVTAQPDVRPLETLSSEEVTDDMLENLGEQVATLHAAGVAHGRLNASNVLVLDGGPMLVDFSAATIGAPQSALDIDLAELLVACTVLVGADRALVLAVDAGLKDDIGRVLPYLQRAALTPHLRDLARSHEIDLEELRVAAAAATGQEAPELVPMRRIRPRDLLLTAALIVGAYLLISKLAAIGFGTIAHAVANADLAWLGVALLLAQITFVANGVAVRGSVMTPLPLLPSVVLQSAIKFINLTVPSSAGRIGMSVRFLQRLGTPLPEAVAAGAVDDTAETLVQAALLLVALPFVHAGLHTSGFHAPSQRLVAALAAALVLGVAAILVIPKLRAKVVPPVRQGLVGLWSVVRDRRKRLELFGGHLVAQLLYAVALGAICRAYGVDLNLAELVFVNSSASLLSSVIPVPGGIGAAEASLSAGLIALGVDQPTAFAVAISHRLCTSYLPTIWGYLSLRWLTHEGYV